jgi:hypothetical protein
MAGKLSTGLTSSLMTQYKFYKAVRVYCHGNECDVLWVVAEELKLKKGQAVNLPQLAEIATKSMYAATGQNLLVNLLEGRKRK